jgi:hypothetical protein
MTRRTICVRGENGHDTPNNDEEDAYIADVEANVVLG